MYSCFYVVNLQNLRNSNYYTYFAYCRWSDSTPTDFILWSNGEPNDAFGGQKCVRLTSDHGK